MIGMSTLLHNFSSLVNLYNNNCACHVMQVSKKEKLWFVSKKERLQFVGSKWGGVQTGHSCMPFCPAKQVLPLVVLKTVDPSFLTSSKLLPIVLFVVYYM